MAETSAAMVLCAGLGTRLRPLTEEVAKPMVPVGDRPAVAHVLERVRRVFHDDGVARVVVNVHHRPDDVVRWAARENVAVSHEAELLGTAGGVAFAEKLLGEGDVLVWNGDILSDLDPRTLGRVHAEQVGAAVNEATLAVLPRPAGAGNVGFDRDGRIVRLRTERFADEVSGGEFLGIHVLGARLRSLLPAMGCLVGDVYLPALRRGERLAAHAASASFLDVGTLAAYVEANRLWLERRGLSSFADREALVSAPIDGSIVGRGAIVAAPALRCVVWPGAEVVEPVADAVVMPGAPHARVVHVR